MKYQILLCLMVFLLLSCSKKESAHREEAKNAHGHVHTAPHGGFLVAFAHHANLELVLDRKTGTLEAYALDAHAENFVRLAQPSIGITVKADGTTKQIVLEAVANPATGETVGRTSCFRGQTDWLKERTQWDGVIDSIEILGQIFTATPFHFHQDQDHSH